MSNDHDDRHMQVDRTVFHHTIDKLEVLARVDAQNNFHKKNIVEKLLREHNISCEKVYPLRYNQSGEKIVKIFCKSQDDVNNLIDRSFKVEYEIITEREDEEKKVITLKEKKNYNVEIFKRPSIHKKSEEELHKENEHRIKVSAIPLFVKKEDIIASFSFLGEIEKTSEFRHNDGLFKYIVLTYKNKEDIERFKHNQWSYSVNEHSVNVEPVTFSEEERQKREKYCLRLSGLPFKTTYKDIRDIIKRAKGKTCFIPRNPRNYNLVRYAYIKFETLEQMENAKSMDIFLSNDRVQNKPLYWSEAKDKICNSCRNPNHLVKDCSQLNANTLLKKRRTSTEEHWKKLNRSWAEVAKAGGRKAAAQQQRQFNKKGRNFHPYNNNPDDRTRQNRNEDIPKNNKPSDEEIGLKALKEELNNTVKSLIEQFNSFNDRFQMINKEIEEIKKQQTDLSNTQKRKNKQHYSPEKSIDLEQTEDGPSKKKRSLEEVQPSDEKNDKVNEMNSRIDGLILNQQGIGEEISGMKNHLFDFVGKFNKFFSSSSGENDDEDMLDESQAY